jgi:large subunit ribosomal protein L21
MPKDFAVIATGGKQYQVSVGDKIKVENLDAEPGASVLFDAVLLRSAGSSVDVGAPHLTGAPVEAKVIANDKERTKIVFKYHAKARYRKKKGHRQQYTEIEIVKI